MKRIKIIGAGFSGLTLAYYLRKQGLDVEIFEQNPDVGGLIHTLEHPLGLVETAANALIWSPEVQSLFDELGLEMLVTEETSKKRFIFYQGKPQRWPFSFGESLHLFLALVQFIFIPGKRTLKRYESVAQYISRVFSPALLKQLVSPALQGIYAGNPERMSARLILGRFLGDSLPDIEGLKFSRRRRSKGLGSVSPKDGMGSLIQALKSHLIQQGVNFSFKETPRELSPDTVLATSSWSAAQILKDRSPELAKKLAQIESLGLVTATVFYAKSAALLKGFGVLFKRDEGVRSLGVLFNRFIFKNRTLEHSETWILGGAQDPTIVTARDEEILETISRDREKLYGVKPEILSCQITRWPKALPHYTVELEHLLETLETPDGIYLHGNYLGRIGLGQILERSRLLAEKIAEKK